MPATFSTFFIFFSKVFLVLAEMAVFFKALPFLCGFSLKKPKLALPLLISR